MPDPILNMLQEVINADKRRVIEMRSARTRIHNQNRRLKRWARAIEIQRRNGGDRLKDTDHR